MATRIFPLAVLQRMAEFRALLAVSVVLGILLGVGTGAAFAHDPWWWMSGGWSNDYTGTHSSRGLVPPYSYLSYHNAYSIPYPFPTLFILNRTRNYNGWSSQPIEIKFSTTHMYSPEKSRLFSWWNCQQVNGVDQLKFTWWGDADISATNNNVVYRQWVQDTGPYPCSPE